MDEGAGAGANLFPDRRADYQWTSTDGDFAQFNGWLGPQVGGIASGASASRQTMWMDLSMEVKINPAIAVHGQYRVGSYGDRIIADAVSGRDSAGGLFFRRVTSPHTAASEYATDRYPGVNRAFSPGYWNTLWVRAELPWGNLTFGKRPFLFGAGMMFDGSENTSIEALTLSVPYGPLKAGVMWYPARRGSKIYYNPFDDNGKNSVDLGAFVTYSGGVLSAGILGHYSNFHIGPEGAPVYDNDDIDEYADVISIRTMRSQDTSVAIGSAFLKFNNGRIFFNTEVGLYKQQTTTNREVESTDDIVQKYLYPPLNRAWPQYVDHWRFVAELGALAGPAKMSLLYAWVSGGDLRHGIQIDRSGRLPQPFLRDIPGNQYREDNEWLDQVGRFRIYPVSQLTNTQVFKPYSLIMVYNYGLGTDVSPQSGKGWVQDAQCIAARLDYAIASNLNVFGTFFTARRTTNSGYNWGYIRPSLNMDGSVDLGNRSPDNGNFTGQPIPTVPDNDLGWETNVGFNWKLLEGMTLGCTFGYWVPGVWFKYACIDRRINDWFYAEDTELFGVIPSKQIDEIWGMDLKLTADF